MKRLIASVAAAAFIATPALAASTAPAREIDQDHRHQRSQGHRHDDGDDQGRADKKVASRHSAKSRKMAMHKAKKPATTPAPEEELKCRSARRWPSTPAGAARIPCPSRNYERRLRRIWAAKSC